MWPQRDMWQSAGCERQDEKVMWNKGSQTAATVKWAAVKLSGMCWVECVEWNVLSGNVLSGICWVECVKWECVKWNVFSGMCWVRMRWVGMCWAKQRDAAVRQVGKETDKKVKYCVSCFKHFANTGRKVILLESEIISAVAIPKRKSPAKSMYRWNEYAP